MIKGIKIIVLLGMAIFLGFGQGNTETLYGADGVGGNSSNLYILNPSSGAIISTVGPIGYAITGLAIHPGTGELYGSTSKKDSKAPSSLVKINKITAAGTVVGPFSASSLLSMPDITFSTSGVLYGWGDTGDPSVDDLYSINLTTGSATRIGEAGLSSHGNGIAYSCSGVLFLAGQGNNGLLHTVNLNTGATTQVATLNGAPGPSGSSVGALAFSSNGTLYGVIIDNLVNYPSTFLVTINPNTGAVTNLGQSIDSLDAIVFDGALCSVSIPIPIMTEWSLIILIMLFGIGSIIYLRKKLNYNS